MGEATDIIYAVDFESTGLIPYFTDFEVKSLAVAYSDSSINKTKTKFFTTPEDIYNCLGWLSETQAKTICYNLGFEDLVMRCKYPEFKINWVCDVMRMSQLRGLPPDDTSKDRATGFSLKATVKRFLKHMADYEAPAYEWIRTNLVVQRGKEGAYLSQLPYELLKQYNEADAIATLELYWYFTSFFESEGYDWSVDWDLYKTLADFVIDAEIRGIKVNRQQLTEYKQEILQEVAEIDQRFVNKYSAEIEQIREQLRQKQQAKFKKKIVTELPEFNITSKKHLEHLFCDTLGMVPTLTTPKRKPSFKAENLFQWGDGGNILDKRGKRLLVSSQVSNLDLMAGRDEHFHPKLRIVGTKTGRLAGASQKKSYGVSLNLQAISRSDAPLMTSLVAADEHVFVSQDLVRGEPTVICQYTKDKQYKLVNCDMAGRKPYFTGDILISDDQYLTIGSITPFARPKILELIETNGGIDTFGEMWLNNPDELKKPLKSVRKVLKTAVLALGYGAQPKRIYSRCNEVRCPITMPEANVLYESFWSMYPVVRRYTEYCSRMMKRQGYVYNLLGFRCVTDPHKAYNMLIQSTINGVISLYLQELQKLYQHMPITCIHDEIITMIPEQDIEIYKKACEEANHNMNQILEWDIPIRTGFAYGYNLFTAK